MGLVKINLTQHEKDLWKEIKMIWVTDRSNRDILCNRVLEIIKRECNMTAHQMRDHVIGYSKDSLIDLLNRFSP